MTDREFLRLHLAAVWGISAPPLVGAEEELAAEGAPPPWSLYRARLADGDEVAVWRAGVNPAERADLLQRADAAGLNWDADLRMRREVALRLAGNTPTAPASAVARLLTAADMSLVEAFEAGGAAYFLAAEQAPCYGVVVDGLLVSVAHSSRRTEVSCELGVETLPAARRHGYALAVTVAWSTAICQEGLTPIYSALAANVASLGLAA
ncbi:MAG TPA: GNAT family N-acetyltransferase, partial [Ktedonobacterales bacterium]